jgi:ABC-type nickel/cobalt efflux system permease component RcnA
MRRGIVAFALLAAAVAAAHAQPLPAPPNEAPADASWWGAMLATLHQVQGDLWRGLAKAVRAVREEGSLSAMGWLLALSFFYGVVHAAGPGHGKAVIAAYMVGNESAVRRGILLSFLSAAAQGVTAICAVGVLAVLLGFISREVAGVTQVLETASYVLIAGLGLYLLVQTGRSILAGRDLHAHGHQAHDHDHAHHDHHHAHAHTHVAPVDAKNWRQGIAVVAAVGLRPCMGAVFVLLFALAQGVFFFGMLATAAMSLGTAITVAVLAVTASLARSTALRVAGKMDGWLLWTYWGLSLAGGFALLVIGVGLLLTPSSTPFPGAG